MANINLLPWREERRQQLKHDFLMALGIVAATGVALVILTDIAVNSAIDNQNGRNNYLKKKMAELELQVKEIRQLEQKQQQLLKRMKVIQQLQGNRPVIVRIFDEMVRSLPEGVFYNRLFRSNDAIRLTGIAESNDRISNLMRKVDQSRWFDDPDLTAVTIKPDFGEQASEFSLSFNISNPSIVEEGND